MSTRRDLLKNLGLSAAAATTAPLAIDPALRRQAAGALLSMTDSAAGIAGVPAWMKPAFAGAQRGHLGLGWFIVRMSAVQRGAMVLSLGHEDGRLARVHLCAHDGEPRGLAHTALLDFILMDGGQGDRPTEEDLGRVLVSLANRLREHELDSALNLLELATLETHGQRVTRYGPETLV
ncbi:MAG: twin-arginine translocation signal domain-containing protein [Myxococcota bacterium]